MNPTLQIAAEALAGNVAMARIIGIAKLTVMLDRCREAGEHVAAQDCRRALRLIGALA